MGAEINTLSDGTEALVIISGTNTEVYGLDVIAAYSELLGEPDPGKVVVLIRGAMKTEDHNGLWKPLYENLRAGLGELSRAGVPPELMPDVLEDSTAPVPRDRAKLRAARAAAKGRMATGGSQGVAEFGPLLVGKAEKLKASRVDFLKGITPSPPDPDPDLVAESPFSKE